MLCKCLRDVKIKKEPHGTYNPAAEAKNKYYVNSHQTTKARSRISQRTKKGKRSPCRIPYPAKISFKMETFSDK